MSSEKQILANQQNAQKSTGPKTPEGKARSRRNSLKHGLTGAGVVFKKQDQREIDKRIVAYTTKLAPCDLLEEDLVERIAVSIVRTHRCVKMELSDLAKRRRRALQRWENKQDEAVSEGIDQLDTEPGAAVRSLKTSAKGCDWLLSGWNELAEQLAEQGGLSAFQTAEMMRLLGKKPKGLYPADELVIDLRKHAVSALLVGQAAKPHPDAPQPHPSDFGAEFNWQGEQPDINDSRIWLMGLIEAQRTELKALRDATWQETDGPDLAEAQDRILVDTSNHGSRLLRYEATADTTFHRSMNELLKIRKMEPDYQTISRLQKTGRKPSRVWVGTDWMLWSDYAAMMSGNDPREATARSTEASQAAHAEQAEAALRGAKIAPPVGPIAPSVITGWIEPVIQDRREQNRPIFDATKYFPKATSVDPQHRSQTGSETCHEGSTSEPTDASDTGSRTTDDQNNGEES